MKIYTDTPEGVTVVKNSFIDQYMPQANGEFVKVYLYLLRCANTGRELTLSLIADALDHTEKDIRRALSYWEKQELVHLKAGPDGVLQSVTFSDLPDTPEHVEPERTFLPEAAVKKTDAAGKAVQEEAPCITRERLDALCSQQEVRQLFFVAEQYLKRPLSSAEQSDFVYFFDTLKFSADLIEYLLEYCISKGSFSRHYMRRVALGWAEAGISTVLQAKQESNLYNKNYYTILKAFGIKGRSPAKPEMEMMDRWLREYGFPIELIVEACSRTIRTIHQPSFEYADKILRHWKEQHVISMRDIQQLDQQRTEEKQQRAAQKKAEGNAAQKGSGNRFHNFSQRDYDYGKLERQLLN